MNVYEIILHGVDSIYLLAPSKYRALELAGDYLADAGLTRWSQVSSSHVSLICPKSRYSAPRDVGLVP